MYELVAEQRLREDEERVGLLDVESPLSDISEKHRILIDHKEKLTRMHLSVSSYVPTVKLTRLLHLLFRIPTDLLPSFVARRWFPSNSLTSMPTPTIHRTSWLDSLRGLAALAVVAYHWTNFIFGCADVGYGAADSVMSFSWWQLPFIRLLYAGLSNVALFFVISGYALSVRPVALMQDPRENAHKAMRGLSSSVFRRFFRLYIPAWLSTVGPFLFRYWQMPPRLHLYDIMPLLNYHIYPTAVAKYNQTQPFPPVQLLAHPNFSFEFKKLVAANLNMTTILEGSWPRKDFENPYNTPLWTIPIEFRASLLLFLVQIAVAQMRPAARISITILLILWSVIADRWEMVLFLGGFLIAQVDPLILLHELRLQKRKHCWLMYNAFFCCILVLGLYLASCPYWNADHTPGFIWLATHVPSTFVKHHQYFWFSTGALLIVFSISRLQSVAHALMAPSLLYIGEISFALYLVHGFISMIGVFFLFRWGTWTGNLDRHNAGVFYVGFAVSMGLILGAVVWCGDVWCRFVDGPSVRFAKWLEGKLLA